MTNRRNILYRPVFGLLILLLSCQKKEIAKEQKPQPLNSFSMQLNGQAWQPSTVEQDQCMRTFKGAWSSVTEKGEEKPYYTIWAYKDPRAVGIYGSENAFEFQIFDVKKTGTYTLTGSYKEHFSAYALFVVNKPDGTNSRYINNTNKGAFTVEVSEFTSLPGSWFNGIKGSFYGTLYNENNPLDSLTLQQGEFTLKKINWYNFNQCAQW
ncbi:MAG: DUF5025 domain-containing protein [Ferruginibacter sp.]|nr:DUF5025 domain-containing protein [Cytophagales bacterium]